ncbi:MAG TPA: efflux RND transporter periplasmic adaptor subunit [Thermoanaerobaculia bacterium]
MTRHALPLSLIVLSALSVGAAACGGHGDSPAAASTGAAGSAARSDAPKPAAPAPPPLPSDVSQVAGIAAAPQPAPQAAAPAPFLPENAGAVAATGEFVSPVRSELAVRMPGRVGRVLADEGARVKKGQPLLELETQYLSLDLQRTDADLARARAAAQDAARDLARKRELVAKSSVSQAAYDRSESAAEQAQAAVGSALAARDLARQHLADAVLRSPIDGVVAERRTDVGQRLGDNTVAFVVAQTSPLKLRFKLPERFLSAVRKGQPVRAAVDPYPGETFTGRVSLVGGVVDPATRSFNVETEFENRDGRLTPGLFARVEIDLASAAGPAPAAAPITGEGGSR